MPFGWGRSNEEEAADEVRETALAVDLERLAAGGIPAAAERRVADIAARGGSFFTSGLSVGDFALLHRDQVRPIAQVQGSSVYKLGWRSYPWGRSGWGQGSITELEWLTTAWNEARRLAIGRLREEARHAGADAVLDVTFEQRQHDFVSDSVEVIVRGTAAHVPRRADDGRHGDEPRLSDLSAPDWVLLHQAGHRAVGVVAATSAVYVAASAQTRRITTGWQRWQGNQEIGDFTQGVYTARELALTRAQDQALALGAEGLVGASLDVAADIREYEVNDTKYEDLIVTAHVLGTAIVADSPSPPPPTAPTLIVRQGGRA